MSDFRRGSSAEYFAKSPLIKETAQVFAELPSTDKHSFSLDRNHFIYRSQTCAQHEWSQQN